MRGCEAWEVEISALVDGELETIEIGPTVDHLVACEACRRFWSDSRTLNDALLESSLPEASGPAPAEVWRRIEERTERREEPGKVARRAWPRVAGLIAAVLVVAASAWSFIATLRPTEPRPDNYLVVVLGGDDSTMTDERFVELATEVLRSDRRYHRKMLEVMQYVTREVDGLEGSTEGVSPAVEEPSDAGAPEEGSPEERRRSDEASRLRT